jgi:hypothetical protein
VCEEGLIYVRRYCILDVSLNTAPICVSEYVSDYDCMCPVILCMCPNTTLYYICVGIRYIRARMLLYT